LLFNATSLNIISREMFELDTKIDYLRASPEPEDVKLPQPFVAAIQKTDLLIRNSNRAKRMRLPEFRGSHLTCNQMRTTRLITDP